MKIKLFISAKLEALKEPLLNVDFIELTRTKAQADVILSPINEGENSIVIGKDLLLPIRLISLLTLIKKKVANRIIYFHELGLEPLERKLSVADSSIILTDKEAEIIRELFSNKKISKEVLLKNVWGYNEDIQSNTLETHISKLRGKLQTISDRLIVFEDNYLMMK